MLKNSKKILLIGMLSFIVFSFSGCLGIDLTGSGSSSKSTASSRNDSQGVFKTTDGGKTWQQKITIEGTDIKLSQVTIGSIAIDPDNTKVLYLGTLGDGMFKTENGGDSWYRINDQSNKLKGNSNLYDIEVESGNSNIVYAAALNDNRGVLLKTEDAGKNWSEVYISTELGKQVNRVQIDAIQRNVIYIGTEQGGFLKSTNRGNDWAEIKWFDDLTDGVKDFVVDYKNSKGIIILTHKGLFKTIDGGADKVKSWTDLTKTLTKTTTVKSSKIDSISSLTIDNQNPLMIYMTYLNLVFVTRDGGMTWDTLKTITPPTIASKKTPDVVKIGTVNGSIYYGSGNAIYKSNNKGQTWSSFDIPLAGDVKYTVSDPKDPNIFYVGSFVAATKK